MVALVALFPGIPPRAAHSAFVPDVAAQDAANARSSGVQKSVEELLQEVAGEGAKDPEAWFRLGLAHEDAGNAGAALEAFRRAVKLRPDFVAARAGVAYILYSEGKLKDASKEAAQAVRRIRIYNRDDFVAYSVRSLIQLELQSLNSASELQKAERALAKKPDDARWHLRKAFAVLATAPVTRRARRPFSSYLSPSPSSAPPMDESTRQAAREALRKRYEEAADSFEKYLSLKPGADDRAFVLDQLEALRFYARASDAGNGERVFSQLQVNTKATIYRKPEPGYTEEARAANVSGIVRLRAVLGADGVVKHVIALTHLSHGLTAKAMAAARAIKFNPATVDGKPVSQFVILEYNFNIY